MQIYFDSRLCSYLSKVPILVEGAVTTCRWLWRCYSCINKGSSDCSVAIIAGPFFSKTYFFLKDLSKIPSDAQSSNTWDKTIPIGPSSWKDCFLKLLDLQSHHIVRFEHLELKDSTLRPALTKHHGNTFNQGQ